MRSKRVVCSGDVFTCGMGFAGGVAGAIRTAHVNKLRAKSAQITRRCLDDEMLQKGRANSMFNRMHSSGRRKPA